MNDIDLFIDTIPKSRQHYDYSKMEKLKDGCWILDSDIFERFGTDIIRRWREGDGNWLDIAIPNKVSAPNGNLLDFGSLKSCDDVLNGIFDRLL